MEVFKMEKKYDKKNKRKNLRNNTTYVQNIKAMKLRKTNTKK